MASTTLISVEEYLRTNYEPDCDYVDGQTEERNLGEYDHAALQGELIFWFRQHRREWNIKALPEQRVEISQTRFRVPDVCLIPLDYPIEQILTQPPLACIEILSPEDRLSRLQEKTRDYQHFGVPNIWIVDPATERGFNCTAAGWLDVSVFQIPNTPIRLVLADIFAEIKRNS
ncbi:MAG: Uma2 family endonuclease [Terriglobales bacterium]|jgi:Uma2 family endonuclease